MSVIPSLIQEREFLKFSDLVMPKNETELIVNSFDFILFSILFRGDDYKSFRRRDIVAINTKFVLVWRQPMHDRKNLSFTHEKEKIAD